MHEQSLVRSLLAQVEQLRLEHDAVAVTRVEVEIGPLSGVEPVLVREAFDQLLDDRAERKMELLIHEVPLKCRCRVCRAEWSTSAIRFVCPACGANSVQVISGDEFRIRSIVAQFLEPVGARP